MRQEAVSRMKLLKLASSLIQCFQTEGVVHLSQQLDQQVFLQHAIIFKKAGIFMKSNRFFVPLLALVLALVLCTAGCSTETESGALQSFTASTLDGGTFTQDDIQSKDLTIINFWGTFCAPCIKEMPDLAEFSKALPENVQFITVCVDAQGNLPTAEAILQQAGYDGITLISADGDLAELMNSVQAVPTTIFVDTDGKLAGKAIQGGGYENLSEVFLSAANKALKASGKAEISLEG